MNTQPENKDPDVPTLGEFLACNVEKGLADTNDPDCTHYYSFYSDRAKESAERQDHTGENVFRLLASICSLRFQFNNKREPFTYLGRFGNKRTALVQDYSDREISLLSETVEHIQDPELKARIADVVWLRKRDRSFATQAIHAYLASAAIPREFYFLGVERIRRALQLAKSLNDAETIKQVDDDLSSSLSAMDEDTLVHDGYHAITMLIEERIGDATLMGSLCQRAAKRAEETRKGILANRWWLLHRDWVAILGDKEAKYAAIMAAAENYVRMADDSKESALIESANLEKAIELLRTVPDVKERVTELHKRLNEAQLRSLGEMKKYTSPPVDISGYVLKARESVSAKTFEDALAVLAHTVGFTNKVEAEKFAERQIKTSPLMHIIGGAALSSKGKRVANKSTILSDDPSDAERAVYEAVLQQVSMSRGLACAAAIEPMREEIVSSHPVSQRSFLPLVTGNPFVPESRRHIFAKGLYLGMIGELFEAAHILVPQIENSLRDLLERSGEIANFLGDDFTQDEYPINKVLDHPKMPEIWGSEDLLFALRAFLIEKQSANFRHELCHGLLDDRYLFASENLYAWWLTLHLCHLFEFVRKAPKSSDEKQTEPR